MFMYRFVLVRSPHFFANFSPWALRQTVITFSNLSSLVDFSLGYFMLKASEFSVFYFAVALRMDDNFDSEFVSRFRSLRRISHAEQDSWNYSVRQLEHHLDFGGSFNYRADVILSPVHRIRGRSDVLGAYQGVLERHSEMAERTPRRVGGNFHACLSLVAVQVEAEQPKDRSLS